MTQNSDNNEMTDIFKNGSLVRLLLKDFMTYSKIELNCGPNLNLVLGPNGTGKSALVCGIIIGLGGEMATTGRSGHLGEYIRFGSNSALIEIELFNEKTNAKNFLIQRTINATQSRNGKTEYNSSFRLNERDCNRTQMREFVKSLNINVDNLCQFLPQERVIEFVKMDPKTLLECTEKAAGDVDMFDSHKQIVELSKDIKKLNDMNLDLNNQITTENELQVRAEEELRRVEERDKFRDEIIWLKKKRPWIEYEDKRKQYVQQKEVLVQNKEDLKLISKSLDPLRSEVNDLRKDCVKCETNKRKAYEELKTSAKLIEPIKAKIEESNGSITDSKLTYFSKLEEENKRKQRLIKLEEELALNKEKYENISENINVDQDINEIKKELTRVNSESSQLNQQNMKLKGNYETLNSEKINLESTKKRISNIFNSRLDKLRELNLNARKAYDWLSKNEDKFADKIYPPIMTQINMKRHEWAKYVETAISKNDLISFICENSDDLKLFTDSIKSQLNIRVNVVLAPKENANDFIPDFEIKNYSKYGIHCCVKDMFTAPNKVMAYLCKTSYLHSIPVGNGMTDSKIEHIINCSNFRRIFTEENMYNITISRYDNEKVIQNNSIPNAKYLNLVIDENLLKQTETKISKIEINLNKVKEDLQKNEQTINQISIQSKELFQRKKLLENKKNEKKMLETKIGEINDRIVRCKDSSIDTNAAKIKANDQLKDLEQKQLDLMIKLNQKICDCIERNDQKLKSVLNETFSKKRLQISERKLMNASTQFQDLKKEIERIAQSLNDFKNEAKELRNKAKNESKFDVNDCSPEIKAKFDSLPETLEEIDVKIGTLKLRMNSILDADESVRDAYNIRRRNIEKSRKDLESKKLELREKQTKLEDVKNRWLPSLEQLVAKINTNFGTFMARLNCAGEVSLYRGNDVDSFNEYGISIKVKFRQTEQLKELTSFHQSGGERSVSTMIYMIALQELTHVPFRCVDEINQGMDENNERSVFDLISESSSRNSSQYFLFSPKLLPDLKYTEKMKIHIIFNGPFMEFDWNQINYQNDGQSDGQSDDE